MRNLHNIQPADERIKLVNWWMNVRIGRHDYIFRLNNGDVQWKDTKNPNSRWSTLTWAEGSYTFVRQEMKSGIYPSA